MRKVEEIIVLDTEHGFDLEVLITYDLEVEEPVAVDVGFGENLAVEPGYLQVTVTSASMYGQQVPELISKIQQAIDNGYLELG